MTQPGWRDFTVYYYTIVDKNQDIISFKKNRQYKIMIDDVLYVASNIPSDSFNILKDENKLENHIQINDVSLVTAQKSTQY